MPKDTRTEKQIQKSITEYLGWRGVPHTISDVGLMRNEQGEYRYKRGTSGWPDITAILPGGTFWGIEVKRIGGKVSDIQRAIREVLLQEGAVITVAYSANDVHEVLENYKKENRV